MCVCVCVIPLANPVVMKCLSGAPEDSVFIYCGVGGRDL